MIAFVIVAAALAFVVLNMGFTTSQKAKTSIISSLGEASSSMQVAGKVLGYGHTTDNKLNMTAFPIKVSSGGDDINLEAATTAVRYVSNTIDHNDIYVGTLSLQEYKSLTDATAAAVAAGNSGDETFGHIDASPITGAGPVDTRAFIYFTQISGTMNDILSQGESAVLAVAYDAAERPAALDKIRVEIITPTGSALTVERQVPTVTHTIVDLG